MTYTVDEAIEVIGELILEVGNDVPDPDHVRVHQDRNKLTVWFDYDDGKMFRIDAQWRWLSKSEDKRITAQTQEK